MFIESGLVATFTSGPAIVNQATTFDASGSFSGSGSTIRLYTWDWDDAPDQSSESATIDHTFTTTGDHSVRLVITDSEGRTATVTRTITVAPAP
jgi:PKD repeat protein